MPKKIYENIPSRYTVCQHSDCPMASTCLHQIAYEPLMKSENFLSLINPMRCKKNEKCEFYRNNTPVEYARGFTNFQKYMYPQQYQAFMNILIAHFSRNSYFERRRGDSPLSPKEQKIVLNALQEAGVDKPLRFDSYEERINWYD